MFDILKVSVGDWDMGEKKIDPVLDGNESGLIEKGPEEQFKCKVCVIRDSQVTRRTRRGFSKLTPPY